MKRFLLMATLIVMSAITFAQSTIIKGTVIDGDMNEPMEQATVQLLKRDSSYVTGAAADVNGNFALKVSQTGTYIIKVTSVGYVPAYAKAVVKDTATVNVGNIKMSTDAILLKGAEVTANAVKVTLKEDTFVYNASAYRTPEGSVLEELIKRLPGAQIDDDGKITINGKEVKKILVDGKEFMTGDTKTAVKNIPTSIIQKVKAYDQKSDLSRVTGIEDGEEETVLDFGVKPGMNKGFFSNMDLSVGTKDRYAERAMAAYFKDNLRLMAFGNANNTNDMGFPGGGGMGNWGRGRNGLNSSKMIGVNMNYEEKNKLKVDASVRWNHSDGDARSKSATENFVSSIGSFSNSLRQNYTRSDSWNMRGRVEWMPDTMTNIMFRPSISISKNDSRSASTSMTYKDDPYLYVDDPLSENDWASIANDTIRVNGNNSRSITYGDSKLMNGTLQLNRKLNSMGRNVTLRFNGSYGDSDGKTLSLNDVSLYQMLTAAGADSTYHTYRYNLTPTKNWSYSAQATYSEPLWRRTYLQFSYQFQYSYSKSDRSTYDFSDVGSDLFSGMGMRYRSWNSFLSLLPNSYEDYKDDDLSRFSEYKNYTQEMQVMFRMIRDKYNMNVGVMVQPQKSHYLQNYQGIKVDTVRTVTNFSPTFDFRYRFSKVSNLRINYRGSTSQPSISQLLDITDDSDPLNISKGNPGLKPSFTQRFRLFYNTYFERYQRALMTFVNFSTTKNSISNKVTYDAVTGGRTTRPENINGNWDVNGAFMFNTSLDTLGRFNVNTFTRAQYNNYVSYLSLDKTSSSQKNVTRSLNLSERLETSYRNSWLELTLDGSFSYTHSKNKLQSASNLDTWQFAYGGSIGVTMPWGTSINTDLHQNSRRGYSDNSMNTNELVWNAQIAQSFLKNNALTLSLQFYDILHEQSNFSRTINSYQKSDVEYNSINSYAMLHAIYRFSMFGNGKMPEGPGGMNRGGNRRGGFGGGRPGGGGFGGPR